MSLGRLAQSLTRLVLPSANIARLSTENNRSSSDGRAKVSVGHLPICGESAPPQLLQFPVVSVLQSRPRACLGREKVARKWSSVRRKDTSPVDTRIFGVPRKDNETIFT